MSNKRKKCPDTGENDPHKKSKTDQTDVHSENQPKEIGNISEKLNDIGTKIGDQLKPLAVQQKKFLTQLMDIVKNLGDNINVVAETVESESKEAGEEIQEMVTTVQESFHAKKKEIEAMANKIKKAHVKDPIKFNVGGTRFITSLLTLGTHPDSMLAAMFSGNFTMKAAEDGHFFIDRDGTYFSDILNYLRDNDIDVPEDKGIRSKILREASFYDLKKLEMLMTYSNHGSRIATANDFDWLKQQFQDKPKDINLLFVGAGEEDEAKLFHNKCDGKGPTIVLVETECGRKFGGFSDISWNSNVYDVNSEDDLLFSDKAFTFSLSNAQGIRERTDCVDHDEALVTGISFAAAWSGSFYLFDSRYPDVPHWADYQSECYASASELNVLGEVGDTGFEIKRWETFSVQF